MARTAVICAQLRGIVRLAQPDLLTGQERFERSPFSLDVAETFDVNGNAYALGIP